jgi:hypothetical protein
MFASRSLACRGRLVLYATAGAELRPPRSRENSKDIVTMDMDQGYECLKFLTSVGCHYHYTVRSRPLRGSSFPAIHSSCAYRPSPST